MAVSVLGVGTVAYLQYARVEGARAAARERGILKDLPVLGEVPAFSLTERSEKPVALDDLRGRVWVADFIFTNCAGPCPVMSRRMQDLQAELLRDRMDKVVCVSFSVDPERDTPAALREYADQRGASPSRWLFVTGPKAALRALCVNGFKLAVQDDASPDDQILHSSRFVLVDKRGRIRGYYRALADEEEQDVGAAMQRPMNAEEKLRLMRDIQALLRESDS